MRSGEWSLAPLPAAHVRPPIDHAPVNILRDPDARPVVGHRGACAHAPENTLESFRRARELGAEALELDVHLTRDGHVVVIHDPDVARTTDGQGAVASLTLAQVQALDAGARWTRDDGRTYPWRGRGARIPTLDALLEEFPGVPMMIDAKSADVAVPLARLLAHHGAQPDVLVGSFSATNLAPFAGAEWSRLATRDQSIRLLLRALVGRSRHRAGYTALAIPPHVGPLRLPMARIARAARANGQALHIWTVNDPEFAVALWRAGANGLVGDDPAMLLQVRATIGALATPTPSTR